ncbi:MAG: MFS transporter, partial [Planctomycetota bacterium]
LYDQLIKPFVDLIHAPRALWGVNIAYVLEGMVYFGMLGYLAIHFSEHIFLGVNHADIWSHNMVGVLTAGITISMFFLGFVGDKIGVRRALIVSLFLMLIGRVFISAAPTVLGLQPEGLWSPLHLLTMGGILFVVIGYGMYQPSAYAAVRQFTTPKTAAMGFAMLYALMNLGGWFPTFAFLLRDDDYLGIGISGTFWVYTVFTAVALVVTIVILSRKTVEIAINTAKEETARIKAEEKINETDVGDDTEAKKLDASPTDGYGKAEAAKIPLHLWFFASIIAGVFYWRVPATAIHEGIPVSWDYCIAGLWIVCWFVLVMLPGTARWLAKHPLADGKFFFFIFALIPVQTLFTYNWLVLPQYISRAFDGWIGEYFEIASNANPILIFILVPIIAALTRNSNVYRMMTIGTLVMAAPAFILVIGPHWWTLLLYILIMTVGEAMWQPRFLQYAAEIAPEGRTGEYMGVAQLPWFLTKVLVPVLYSGWMMDQYCSVEGPRDTETMWLIFGCIAISSTIMLMLAKRWIGKDLKTKAD